MRTLPGFQPSLDSDNNLLGKGLADLSCPSVKVCVAVGDTGGTSYQSEPLMERTSDGGLTWTAAALPWRPQVPVPGGVLALGSVACSTVSDCMIGANYGQIGHLVPSPLITTNGGSTWQQIAVPADLADSGPNVTCVTVTECVAYGPDYALPGSKMIIAGTSDEGATWSEPRIVNECDSDCGYVVCISQLTCLSVNLAAYSALSAVLPGTKLVLHLAPRSPVHTQFLNTEFACPTSKLCLGVITWQHGKNGAISTGISTITTNGGRTWITSRLPEATVPIEMDGIACPSATACVAIGLYSEQAPRHPSSLLQSVGLVLSTTSSGRP